MAQVGVDAQHLHMATATQSEMELVEFLPHRLHCIFFHCHSKFCCLEFNWHEMPTWLSMSEQVAGLAEHDTNDFDFNSRLVVLCSRGAIGSNSGLSGKGILNDVHSLGPGR